MNSPPLFCNFSFSLQSFKFQRTTNNKNFLLFNFFFFSKNQNYFLVEIRIESSFLVLSYAIAVLSHAKKKKMKKKSSGQEKDNKRELSPRREKSLIEELLFLF